MLCYYVIVCKMPDKICGFPIYIVDTVEDIPSCVFIPFERGIEQIGTIALEVNRSSFLDFDRQIVMNVAKKLL